MVTWGLLHTLWLRLIRWAFWVLYNPLAWMYDWISQLVSLGHWHDWQREALSELRGDRILELAFGTGNMLLELHTARYRPVGLDLSPTMIRIARRKLHKQNIMAPLVRGRAQQLPFADESFDAILCTFPAEFIIVPDTLGQIARVLCPGGRAVVTAMSTLTTQDPLARFLEWLYWITGQRGSLPNLQPQLESLGLESWTKWKQVKGSAVLLVMIEKRVDS